MSWLALVFILSLVEAKNLRTFHKQLKAQVDHESKETLDEKYAYPKREGQKTNLVYEIPWSQECSASASKVKEVLDKSGYVGMLGVLHVTDADRKTLLKKWTTSGKVQEATVDGMDYIDPTPRQAHLMSAFDTAVETVNPNFKVTSGAWERQTTPQKYVIDNKCFGVVEANAFETGAAKGNCAGARLFSWLYNNPDMQKICMTEMSVGVKSKILNSGNKAIDYRSGDEVPSCATCRSTIAGMEKLKKMDEEAKSKAADDIAKAATKKAAEDYKTAQATLSSITDPSSDAAKKAAEALEVQKQIVLAAIEASDKTGEDNKKAQAATNDADLAIRATK